MQTATYRYIVTLQFLGFRYSGWQKQPGQKTIEGMLLKTLKFLLPQVSVKILGAGRTDAKVSALDYGCEIFLKDTPLDDILGFTELLNKNLPPDIRVLNVEQTDSDFNIIKSSKSKEYVYLFSYGAKNHPFCAPFMANIIEDINIDLMKSGASLFMGTHNFSCFTAQLRENSKITRTIENCYIEENKLLTANFFPPKSYALRITGQGFMRYQVRMIMGSLIQLGKGELTLNEIEECLKGNNKNKIEYIAPGSGLLLNSLQFT